jgi:hypothetical protein
MYRSLLQAHLGYRSLLQAHLAQAEFRVAESELHAAGQRAMVAELEKRDGSTATAKELLALLEELQALCTAHRDGLKQRLDAYHADTIPSRSEQPSSVGEAVF